MRTPPTSLDIDDLADHVRRHWALDVVDLAYAPVGFGSHHWWLTTAAGDRCFVTADEWADDTRHADLVAAMSTATALHDRAGLAFVVAARPAADGSVVRRLTDRWSVAVFPAVDGRPWPADDQQSDDERDSLVDLLGQLHRATPYAESTVRCDGLTIESRGDLERALSRLTEPRTGGPFARPTQELLTRHAAVVRRELATHDRWAEAIRGRDEPWVVTHGEPKPDNWLATAGGPVLVDWDTVLLAPAARDLWLVESGSGAELRRYADVTGRAVHVDDLRYYRLRWALVDVALYVTELLGPHERTADTELAWAALAGTLEELASGH